MTVTLNLTNSDRDAARNTVVLQVEKLRVHYATPLGDVIAVNGVDLKVFERETIGLVGESGCGKSTLAMSILRLVQPPGRIVSGRVQIHGTDLMALSEEELRQVRWNQIALIPQGAMNSLNPVMRLKDQIAEAIETHQVQRSPQELKERILRLLAMVGLEEQAHKLPIAVSTGQQQSAAIARALATDPPLIVADEPTGNLDSRSAENIINLFDQLTAEGKTIAMVTHDPSLTSRTSRTVIISDGKIIKDSKSNL